MKRISIAVALVLLAYGASAWAGARELWLAFADVTPAEQRVRTDPLFKILQDEARYVYGKAKTSVGSWYGARVAAVPPDLAAKVFSPNCEGKLLDAAAYGKKIASTDWGQDATITLCLDAPKQLLHLRVYVGYEGRSVAHVAIDLDPNLPLTLRLEERRNLLRFLGARIPFSP